METNMKKGSARSFDRELGHKVRLLRQINKMPQQALAQILGVTFQQVQKYENGKSRMPPEKIRLCARTWGVSVDYFFGAETDTAAKGLNKVCLSVASEIMALPNDDVRKSVYFLVRAINKSWAQDIQTAHKPENLRTLA